MMLHSWKKLAVCLRKPERMNHVVGALEVPIEHTRVIGIDAQLFIQQTL